MRIWKEEPVRNRLGECEKRDTGDEQVVDWTNVTVEQNGVSTQQNQRVTRL